MPIERSARRIHPTCRDEQTNLVALIVAKEKRWPRIPRAVCDYASYMGSGHFPGDVVIARNQQAYRVYLSCNQNNSFFSEIDSLAYTIAASFMLS